MTCSFTALLLLTPLVFTLVAATTHGDYFARLDARRQLADSDGHLKQAWTGLQLLWQDQVFERGHLYVIDVSGEGNDSFLSCAQRVSLVEQLQSLGWNAFFRDTRCRDVHHCDGYGRGSTCRCRCRSLASNITIDMENHAFRFGHKALLIGEHAYPGYLRGVEFKTSAVTRVFSGHGWSPDHHSCGHADAKDAAPHLLLYLDTR